MSLNWDESLVLGFDEIDNQHKSIFDHFKKLSEAVQLGKSKEIIEELADFIVDYANTHFIAEEKLMLEHAYPKIETHRSEHDEFSRDAKDFRKRVEQDGATREVAIEMTGMLLRWIIRHIRQHDMEMAAFVKEGIKTRSS